MIYTKVETCGDNLFVSGIFEGKKFNKKVLYKPSYFIPSSNADEEFKTYDGTPLTRKTCTIKEYYSIEKENRYYGLIRPQYQFIHQYFNECQKDENSLELIDIWVYDIETNVTDCFPKPEFADEPIITISLKKLNSDKVYVFCFKDFDNNKISSELEVEVIKYCYDNESAMLKAYCSFIKTVNPQIMIGWNSQWFDWLYICNRIKKTIGDSYLKKMSSFNHFKEVTLPYREYFKKNYSISGMVSLDMLEIYKKFSYKEHESYSLNYIAGEELGLAKLSPPDLPFKEFIQRWDEFVKYNIYDILLVEKIQQKTKLVNLVFLIAYFSGINFEDVSSEIKQWESIIYGELYDRGIAIPPKGDGIGQSYPGGAVMDTITGLHDWVVVYDVTSLYPSLMRSLNISFDTLVDQSLPMLDLSDIKPSPIHPEYCVAASGNCFTKDKEGVFNYLMTKFFNKRKYYKQLMKENKGTPLEAVYDSYQLAVKIMINSLYGASGNAFFRYYDVRIASSVTLSGQLLIKWVMKYTNKKLNEKFGTYDVDYIVASDTDSIMFSFGDYKFESVDNESKLYELINFCESNLTGWINDAIDIFCKATNVYQNVLAMEREPVAIRGIFQRKKRYILRYIEVDGKFNDSGKLKIKGVDSVRSSTPSFYRQKLTEFYKLLLRDDFQKEDVYKFIKQTEKENKEQPLEKICFPRTANNIQKYSDQFGNPIKGCPFHVRAALNYNKIIRENNLESEYDIIGEGDKIKFTYLKKNNFGFSTFAYKNRVPTKVFDLHSLVDYDMMMEKAFMSPVNNICEQININPNGQLTLF